MSKKQLLKGAIILGLLASSSVAFGHTTTDPGVPNTGAGGNAATNSLVLLASGLAAAGAGVYLARHRFAH